MNCFLILCVRQNHIRFSLRPYRAFLKYTHCPCTGCANQQVLSSGFDRLRKRDIYKRDNLRLQVNRQPRQEVVDCYAGDHDLAHVELAKTLERLCEQLEQYVIRAPEKQFCSVGEGRVRIHDH